MREVEYFYSAHSAYAYLGSKRLSEICAAHGCALKHYPVALTPVVEASGAQPFPQRSRTHVDYYFGREIERWAEWRGVPIIDHRPTHHDNDYSRANGMILRAPDEARDALAHAVLEAHWRDDADLANPGTLVSIADGIRLDGAALLGEADKLSTRDQLDANTEEAIRRGVLGSPSYFLDGDMFYGQDRLEMLERALETPFAAPGFTNP
ncbi:MAG: 2-hydroxychromene-2-carboxylate isomerase [Pseudomonadota bacterium]